LLISTPAARVGRRCPAFLLAAVVVAGVWATDLPSGGAAAQEDSVVRIQSDRLDADQRQQQVVFQGNVVARQGDLTIQGDRLTVFYLKEDAAEVKADNLARRVDRIVVEGNVRISQRDCVATGEHAVYHRSENKVVLTGQPEVRRERDVISGTSITLFLASQKSVVEGGPSGPVEATIFTPEEEGGGFIDEGSAEATGHSATESGEGG
jgi:lipopolysaccharide export system protein LptA